MIRYVTGDLFETKIRCIGHGCNAQGVMGKGVAKLIREKYPKAYEEYKTHKRDMGSYTRVDCGDKVIYNLVTQFQFYRIGGDRQKRFVSYDAVLNVFQRLNEILELRQHGLAIPLIGAGLGGGDWNVIEGLIDKSTPDISVTVYLLKELR